MSRGAKLTKWKPKKWQPAYERIVAYSALGWSNIMIAQQMGYTKEHISNILNLDEAEEFRKQLLAHMREKAMLDIPQTLQKVAEKGVERLKQFVENDELAENQPFGYTDRILSILKATKTVATDAIPAAAGGITVNQQNNFIGSLPKDKQETLLEGLNKALEVRQLHDGSVGSTGTDG